MRFLLTLVLLLLFDVFVDSAQETGPTPTPTPTAPQTVATPRDQSSQTQTAPVTPVASPTPTPQQAPQLLPESKTLPTQPAGPPLPYDLIPQGAKPQIPGAILNPASAEQLEKDKVRFRELRTIAVRNPYAVYFWRRAMRENTDELKREYLRVYYVTMCDQMRKMEPRLKPMIDSFENGNIARLSPLAQRPTIPGRDIPRFEAAQRAEKPN